MTNYYIDIIDTTSPLTQIVLKDASANGIVLEWNGGDTKDNQTIVASNLKFDMLTLDASDAAFAEFFTGNETQFKVLIKSSVDDSILWQGYILPDLYSEPYKNVCFFVSFTATDGLGRLKGKYLPEEYYSREKSLIDIYCQILRLTGLELELYFAPAIENFVEKNWNKIYIDTESFIDGKKKKDAYSIFETLLSDTLCVCYQCDNRWYIEGINMRHVRYIDYKKYDIVGNYLGLIKFDRLLKAITPLVTPVVTIIPPYNEIVISHKKTEPSIPKTASNEINDGWALVTGVVGIIDPSDWMANGNYYAKCPAPGYFTTIYNQYYFDGNNATTWAQDDTKYISLRKQLYFQAAQKVKFTLDFNTVHRNPAVGGPGVPANWHNVFKYEILFNGTVLFSNFGGTVEDRENLLFDDSGNCKIEIEHVFPTEGIADIKIYRPIGRVADNGVLGIKFNKIDISILDFIDEEIVTDLINGDFTIDKTIDLTYAEDRSGFSNGFRLAKLKEDTSFYNEIEVPILYGFDLNSKHYTVVQLEGANLIKENKYQVFYSSNLVQVNDVIYNFENGEQMVIETVVPFTSGSFFVRKYAVESVLDSRTHWTQWADAFYKIENISFVKTVSNIYRRMFNVAHEKLDVTALNAVKFNDLVQFHYVFMKDFVVLNCSWNLDENKTSLVLARANYKDSTGINPTDENIPPIVIAGDDVFIADGVTTASLLATAYDPDGFIASQIWTKTVGDTGEVIATPTLLGTALSNLTGDFYTFQIQVTDNKGATAVDSVNVIRTKNYTVSLDLVETITNPLNPQIVKKRYKLNVSPAILPNYILNFTGVFYVYARSGAFVIHKYQYATAWGNIEKNGSVSAGVIANALKNNSNNIKEETFPVSFNMISSDEIYIVLCSVLENSDTGIGTFKALANFKLQTVKIGTGIGAIVGLPIEKETLLINS